MQSIDEFLGRNFEDCTGISSQTMEKLRNANQQTMQEHNLSVSDYLITEHYSHTRSLRDLEIELKVSRWQLVKLLDSLGVPRKGRIESLLDKYHDPVQRDRMVERLRTVINDPEHKRKMSERAREVNSRPEVRAKIGKASRARWQDPEYYARVMPKIQATLRKKWRDDPGYRERIIEGSRRTSKDPQRRRNLSLAMKRMYAENPELAEAYGERARARWQDPEYRRRGIELLERVHNDPAIRERLRQKTTERWQDPEYKARVSSSIKKTYENPELRARVRAKFKALWRDPVYRAKMERILKEIREDPIIKEKMKRRLKEVRSSEEYKRAKSEETRLRWQEPEYRRRGIELLERVHNDPAIRERLRQKTTERWQDPSQRDYMIRRMREIIAAKGPAYRASLSERMTRLWANPEFRGLVTQKLSDIWDDPNFKDKVEEAIRNKWIVEDYFQNQKQYLRSIHGERRDIGYNAKSSWEANLARIFIYCGREFTTDVPFELDTDDLLGEEFNLDRTVVSVDFATRKKNGTLKFYEIGCGYEGYSRKVDLKLELLTAQYPDINIEVINQRRYGRLQRHFRERINNDARFVGWEEAGYNLRTNPEDFG